MQLHATTIIVVCSVVVAAGWDLAERRIPNSLTFGASGIAFVYFFSLGGLSGLGFSVAGWIVGCVLFLPLFLLRGLGAGDVKLLAMIGAWVGPKTAVWVFLYAAIAGGVFGVAVALGHGYLSQAYRNLGLMFRYWSTSGLGPVPKLTLTDARGPRLTYAVPMAVGTVLALWLG